MVVAKATGSGLFTSQENSACDFHSLAVDPAAVVGQQADHRVIGEIGCFWPRGEPLVAETIKRVSYTRARKWPRAGGARFDRPKTIHGPPDFPEIGRGVISAFPLSA
jgi:hypothetical protein